MAAAAGESANRLRQVSVPPSRSKLILARTWALVWNVLDGLGAHRASQYAAAMSYYALLSIFPAAIVLAAVAGFVLDDADARKEVVDFLFRELPLSDDEQGRDDIESLVRSVTNNYGTLGVIGAVGLLFSASALFGSARLAIDAIFGGRVSRGYLRGKGLDLGFVITLGALFVLSFGATLLAQIKPDVGSGVLNVIEGIVTFGNFLVPALLGALTFGIAYVRLPVHRQRLRDVWVGVLVATIGIELLKIGFSFFITEVTDYSSIYGSLGAVIAFMVFTYVAAIVFLVGAEVAHLWPGVRDGDHDPDGEPGPSAGEQILDFGRSLVRRNPTAERE